MAPRSLADGTQPDRPGFPDGGPSLKRRSTLRVTSEELSRHDKVGDVWISIEGKVYDVTDWLENHPGGDAAIRRFAGQDVSDPFLAFHPVTAWALLPQFQIGILTDYNVTPIQADYRKLHRDLKMAGLHKNPIRVYGKYASVMGSLFVLCVLGVVFSQSLLVHVACGALLGLLWIQVGYIAHDVSHLGMFKTSLVNKFMRLFVANILTGVGMEWWRRSHTVHHLACNNVEYDPDIQYMPIFAISSKFFSSPYSYFYKRKMHFDSAARMLVGYQHWTFYPVMAVARVNLYAQSFIVAFTADDMKASTRTLEIGTLALFWVWFSFLLSFMPNVLHMAAFVATAYALTGIQHVQVCLNHFPSPVYEGRPESKLWLELQVKGSLNIACTPWEDWFHGGLNFQIDHHLFPLFPRHNLRKIAPFARAFCEKYDLPYVSVSFVEANLMMVKTLKSAALEARDLSKPAPDLSKSFLWEAANANG